MNRYTRDEIILQGLDLAASPTVTAHDAPNGVVQPNAYSIKWLQNALDMFHRKYPFSSDITVTPMTAFAGSEWLKVTADNTLYLPSNFVIDVKDGLTGTIPNSTNLFKVYRLSGQYFRQARVGNSNNPARVPSYYIIMSDRVRITPVTRDNLPLDLEHYALSSKLEPDDPVNFPDEWTLIEFVRLKALEWARGIDPGTAQMYMTKQLAGLRASGLLNNPEWEDSIPLNSYNYSAPYYSRNGWMGNPNG